MTKVLLRYVAGVAGENLVDSKCNPDTEKSVYRNGSYRCECKDGFENVSGKCEGRQTIGSLIK